MKFTSALLVASVSAAAGDACTSWMDCGWFECCGISMPDVNDVFTMSVECMPDGSDETTELAGQ